MKHHTVWIPSQMFVKTRGNNPMGYSSEIVIIDGNEYNKPLVDRKNMMHQGWMNSLYHSLMVINSSVGEGVDGIV